VNWEAIAKWMLNEAYRRLAWARDETLRKLIAEILTTRAYPRDGANQTSRRRTI
jgi:hypothetical protein